MGVRSLAKGLFPRGRQGESVGELKINFASPAVFSKQLGDSEEQNISELWFSGLPETGGE